MFQVHYMYGATFGQQSKHLRLWIEEDEASGPKPAKLDFMVSVMFWIALPYVSQVSNSCSMLARDCWHCAVHVHRLGCAMRGSQTAELARETYLELR